MHTWANWMRCNVSQEDRKVAKNEHNYRETNWIVLIVLLRYNSIKMRCILCIMARKTGAHQNCPEACQFGHSQYLTVTGPRTNQCWTCNVWFRLLLLGTYYIGFKCTSFMCLSSNFLVVSQDHVLFRANITDQYQHKINFEIVSDTILRV